MQASKKSIWLKTLPAMALPFLAALFYYFILKDSIFARVTYGLIKLFIVVWPIFCLVFFDKIKLSLKALFCSLQENRACHLRSLPAGMIIGLTLVLVLLLMMHSPLGDLAFEKRGEIRAQAVSLGFLEHYVALVLFLSFFHSLLEEYYWRWFVYGNLRQVLPNTSASLLGAAAFAAHHIVAAVSFFGLALGLALGSLVGVGGFIWNTMYEKQKTLAGAWLSHILIDLGILGIGWLLLF